jgi:lysine 6-dehydrogenase
MKIIVLGGGRQGRTIAADLARSFDVTVADCRPARVRGTHFIEADLSSDSASLCARFDLVVGALPSRLGFAAARAAIAARRPMVDLSFFAEDPFRLDRAARRAGVAFVPDAGLSPGLSNLIVGHLAVGATPRHVEIRVGGIAESRTQDYVITWSLEDLIEEYTRPARIRKNERIARVPALSGIEPVRVPRVGMLEAFFSDGLRTLLRTIPARDMAEKTLRWPGHAARMQALRDLGFFERPELVIPVLQKAWERRNPRDLVVLDVVVDGRRATLVERARGGLTAMTRTTALTCAAVAELMAQGGVREKGVVPLERLGGDAVTYRRLRRSLRQRGVRWAPTLSLSR